MNLSSNPFPQLINKAQQDLEKGFINDTNQNQLGVVSFLLSYPAIKFTVSAESLSHQMFANNRKFSYSDNKCDTSQLKSDCYQFLQLMWRSSSKIGCAYRVIKQLEQIINKHVYYEFEILVICRYYPHATFTDIHQNIPFVDSNSLD